MLRLIGLLTIAFICASCGKVPTERELMGTWVGPQTGESSVYLSFNADHTVVSFGKSGGTETIFLRGTWKAQSEKIILRYNAKLHVWTVEDFSPDHVRIRLSPDEVVTYKRAPASMQ